ncbi:MAG: methyltransferase domain-containing protein [Comamonas sp.]|nr:methyltransferase domain-containing protein [Comamonas sp.]
MTCPIPAAAVTLPSSHGAQAPSAWIARFAHLVRPQGQVLDIACGLGRHMRMFHASNHPVTGIDRAQAAIDAVANLGQALQADIESGPWPLPGQQFDAVVVTNYLWRPLWPQILDSVKPGGVLLYETFGQGNEAFGKPSRADFLLAPGELLQVCEGWTVVAYEHGQLRQPHRVVQRIAAIKPEADNARPALLEA